MISLQYVNEAVAYDPLTGAFTWKTTRPLSHFKSAVSHKIYMTRNAGKSAGSPMKGGYISLYLGGHYLLAHRLAFAIHHKIELADLPAEIDHRDTDTSHNWIDNLRGATRITNMYNSSLSKANTSGFKGVSKKGERWAANININGKRKYLGYFDTPEEASEVRNRAANDQHGVFARAA